MPDRWTIGLAGLGFGGLCLVCLLLNAPAIERELTLRAEHALGQVEVATVRVEVEGRDAFLYGWVRDPGEKTRAETAVARVYGVRMVYNALEMAPITDTRPPVESYARLRR